MSGDGPDKTQNELITLMVYATCLSFGMMAAFLYSIRDFTRDASLVFSFGTIVAFVVGWAIGWGFWKVIRHYMAKAEALDKQNQDPNSPKS